MLGLDNGGFGRFESGLSPGIAQGLGSLSDTLRRGYFRFAFSDDGTDLSFYIFDRVADFFHSAADFSHCLGERAQIL
ncbi:hypothetical protein [Tsukamurella hominis]|uniref:hypothetical protein n=1 Tax=Tsukamurella hominis TaxID=1970232 RepID=UPI0039E76B04